MEIIPSERKKSEIIANILALIPFPDDEFQLLSEIFKKAGLEGNLYSYYEDILLSFLKIFDVVSIDKGEDGKVKICAKSIIAKYFLENIAWFIREEYPLFDNWECLGIKPGNYQIEQVLSGPQFLYIAEKRRVSSDREAMPFRKTHVVKAIIKARSKLNNRPVFLVQWDEKVHKYQLIGGHMHSSENDPLIAMNREIEEELCENTFKYPNGYELRTLYVVEMKEVSLTYGVYTQYSLHYFQPIFNISELKLSPRDRWVTKKELLQGKTSDGQEINENAILELEKTLAGGLDELQSSLLNIKKITLLTIIKEHPLETIGIMVGILGIILTIFFFFLS
jgi:hypothetical protein